MCCMYKIRITGTEVSVLGRYSNAPDGVVFGYTLNVTNLPVFNNELESVTIGTNIVSTYPSAHAETLAPRICVLEERSDGTYYVFKTKFPAQTVTLNKGNNTVNFSGKVTAYKGDDYYLIFCDGNNKIVSTPIKVSVIGEEGGTGFIECSGYKLGNFNVGQNANTVLELYCDGKNASTAEMFGVLKNKATGETAYGQYKTVTLEGRAKTSYTYSMLVPANFPTGEADFNVIRTSTGGPDDPWDGGYLVSPVTVTVGTGSGDPDPVTGSVTVDISETHPVLTIGKASTLTFTVKNTTNTAFSKQLMPRIGSSSNTSLITSSVEKIQVNVAANSTGTFSATFTPSSSVAAGEYNLRVFDTDNKEYQARTIPVTVKAAEVPDYTVSNIVCDKTTFNDAFIPGQSTGFTVTLRNTASTKVTEQIRTYLSTQVEGLDKFAFGEYFDVTLAAGETVERTYSVAVPSDMPEGSCTFALLNTSVKAIGGYHTVTIGKTSSETGDCPVEITNINIAYKLEVGKTHSYSLTLHNTSASELKYSIFPTISNEEQDKDVYEANFIVNITLAGGETKVYTSTFAIPGDFPIGNAKLSALRMCDGCPVNFAIYNYPVYIDNNSGVEDLEGENAEEVEWYTLQGVRIYGEPQHGHYYIRRQGSKVQKIKY